MYCIQLQLDYTSVLMPPSSYSLYTYIRLLIDNCAVCACVCVCVSVGVGVDVGVLINATTTFDVNVRPVNRY